MHGGQLQEEVPSMSEGGFALWAAALGGPIDEHRYAGGKNGMSLADSAARAYAKVTGEVLYRYGYARERLYDAADVALLEAIRRAIFRGVGRHRVYATAGAVAAGDIARADVSTASPEWEPSLLLAIADEVEKLQRIQR